MSKKIMKRSLALGALMAFVITGSAWASIDLDGVTIDSTNTSYSVNSSDSTLTINGEIFQNITSPGNQFITITKGTANITDTDFLNIGVNGKSSKAVIISQSGGEVNLTNVVIQPNYKASNGLNVAGNSKANIYGTDNTFKGYMGRGVFNYGLLTFKNKSVTTFSAGANSFDITNRDGGRVVIEDGATVILKGKGIDFEVEKSAEGLTSIDDIGYVDIEGTINGNISGHNCINFNGGILNGKMSEGKNNSNKFTGFCEVEFNGGTWNMTGDSTVAKVVVNGNSTIDGTIGVGSNGDKPVLTTDTEINNNSEYFIKHKSGNLTINNLKIDSIIKETDTGSSRGSVISGYGGSGESLLITNSEISNNISRRSSTGSSNHYAIIDSYADTTIQNTEFKNNTTNYMGGVLYLHGKVSAIEDSKFISNTAGQGAAIQSNGAEITLKNNIFNNNIATKVNDGDCGGAICAEGASKLTFVENNTFDGNKATGTNGNGGAIAQYKGSKAVNTIIFAEGSSTEFKNNTANNNGGAIWNGEGGVIEVNGELNFTGNVANGKGNDIYNIGAININKDASVNLNGGIDGDGATNINGGNLVLKGGTTYVETLGGDGGIIRFESADAKLEVNTNNNDTLKFTATSAVNEAVAGDANALVSEVDWAADTTMVMEAGDIVGEVTAELGENKDTGKLIVKSQTEAANPANQAISDAGIGLKLHYRYHMNDMNKRMGELRNANGEHGVWTRMVRGECEYENSKAQYNQYQLGYDEKLSVDKRWTVGAAVTFSEGDSSYGYGSTEDKSTAFAIYGSKLNNDGTFVDLIARYAHLESDIEDKAGKGDYSTNGMSVSAEVGKRIQQGNGLWIEPQFELTYGNFDSAEFQIGGKTVQVGDMDSLIGRIGFSLGKDIKQGNVYARASYLYDFDGETETAFSNASATRTFKDDLGGGWWEVGVGANINLSKATYIYADVEKAFGGEVDTNWQWNLGVRYSF